MIISIIIINNELNEGRNDVFMVHVNDGYYYTLNSIGKLRRCRRDWKHA